MPSTLQGFSRGAARALMPSLACVFGLITALDVVAHAVPLLSSDGDPALHMLLGRIILERGGLPPSDPTSAVTAARPLVDHEWLAQVALGAAERVLGLSGPVLLAAGLAGATVALVTAEMRHRGVAPWTATAVVVAGYSSLWLHLGVRPHLFGWPSLLLTFIALDGLRSGTLGWRRFALFGLPLFALWANLHGGFVIGLGLFALSAAGEAWKAVRAREARRRARLRRAGRVLGLGAACAAATLLNPYGWRLHRAIFAFLGERYYFSNTVDLAPPRLALLETQALLGFLIVCFVLLALERRRVPLMHWVAFGAFTALALHSVRSAPLLAMLAMVIAAPRLQAVLDRAARSRRRWAAAARALARSNARIDGLERRAGGALLAVAAGALLVAAGRRGALPVHFDPALQPVIAAGFVERHPEQARGQMYNAFHWGGYLAWRFFPRHIPYLHGLNFEYAPATQREYLDLAAAKPGWRGTLARAGVSWVVWPAGTPFATALSSSPCWKRAHADAVAVIYVRVEDGGVGCAPLKTP